MKLRERKVMSITKLGSILAVASLMLATAGCYVEPVSAESVVPAEKRIYLKNTDLDHLTVEAVYEKGLVYDSHWTNLSSRVENFEAFTNSLKSIDYLNFDYNQLTNVDAVASFPALKWLRLNNNKLSHLAGEFKNLSDLRSIYLRGNDFAQIPDVFKDMPSLKSIDLSWNRRITEIPDWLAQKEGLEFLSFSCTAIKSLPKDISKWRSLKMLNLSGLMLSFEEMQRIRSALPETTVVF